MNLTHWAIGIPRVAGLSHDARLLADPYRYLSVLMLTRDSDAVQLRLMGEPTLCLAGGEAAAFFYDASRIQRGGAAPEPLRATLFGKGGVQGLDDQTHRRRKALFLDLLGPAAVAALVERTRREWLEARSRWPRRGELDLYPALQEVLTVAACDWAGLPLEPEEVPLRTRQLVSLFDDAAQGLARHLRARLHRSAVQAWARGALDAVRAGRREPPPASALALIARHRDEYGQLLPIGVAAVELINVLRPIVAVSVYLVFLAHALARHGDWAQRLATHRRGPEAQHFVQEVRRHYPFFPLVAGRTRGPVSWRSARIPGGMRVLLDLYGTNHSRRDWVEPDIFLPERWRAFPLPPPPAFVPQGGAGVVSGHRCPGEDVAVQLMLLGLDIYLLQMCEALPARGAPPLDFGRLPAQPMGGLRLPLARGRLPFGGELQRL